MKLYWDLYQYLIFLFITFSILEIFNPPNLKIIGFFLKSKIVDSSPIEDFPPSRIYLIFFPKSSLTSAEVTALIFEDKLALGAAKGYSNFLSKSLVIGCFGNLTAREFFLLVTNFEIFDFFFKFKTNVIGPGQNFLYSFKKFLFNSQSFLRLCKL